MMLLKILCGIALTAGAPGSAGVPIETDGGVVVRVALNGEGPFPLVLVARAGPIEIRESLLATIGLKTEDAAGEMVLEQIAIGDLLLENVPARPLQRGQPREMTPASGELPLGLLERFLVTVDYPGRRLTIEEGALPPEDGRSIVAFDRNEAGEFTVPLQVDGLRVITRLQLGVSAGLTMGEEYEERLPLLRDREIAGYIETPQGSRNLIRARFSGPVRLGRQDLGISSILFDPRETEARLGYVGLVDHVVTLDQSNRRLWIARRGDDGG